MIDRSVSKSKPSVCYHCNQGLLQRLGSALALCPLWVSCGSVGGQLWAGSLEQDTEWTQKAELGLGQGLLSVWLCLVGSVCT